MRMVRTPRWVIGAALVGALVSAGAHAQGLVTERQAAAYVYGGFLTDSAHAILSKDVKLGPELQRRLALRPDADSQMIYDALVALIDPGKLVVRKAGPDELSRYVPRAGELKQPLFALESGDTTLLIQYDLQANNIPFVGQLAGSVEPIMAKKPAPPAAAELPRPVVAPEPPKEAILPPASRGTLRIPGITPYKIEIQQGNYVSQQMASQLKNGMTKDQVKQILGTPLLTDIFHAERWDYVYLREAPDGKRESRKITLYFEDGKLARMDGDVVPTSAAGR